MNGGLDAVGQAETFEPHLVCLDLAMPLMDGYEAARKIREINKNVILAALSGWDGDGARCRAVEAGFDLHMVKPVKPDDLRSMLAKYGVG